jgi:hypothetical protein
MPSYVVLLGETVWPSVHRRLVVEGLVVEGLVVEGLVVEGLVVEGLVVEGLVVEGLVVEGLVVEGLVVEGLVVEGLPVGSLWDRLRNRIGAIYEHRIARKCSNCIQAVETQMNCEFLGPGKLCVDCRPLLFGLTSISGT